MCNTWRPSNTPIGLSDKPVNAMQHQMPFRCGRQLEVARDANKAHHVVPQLLQGQVASKANLGLTSKKLTLYRLPCVWGFVVSGIRMAWAALSAAFVLWVSLCARFCERSPCPGLRAFWPKSDQKKHQNDPETNIESACVPHLANSSLTFLLQKTRFPGAWCFAEFSAASIRGIEKFVDFARKHLNCSTAHVVFEFSCCGFCYPGNTGSMLSRTLQITLPSTTTAAATTCNKKTN